MKTPAWPAHLTPDERARVAKIDAELAKLTARAEPLKAERAGIANRAAQRARYASRLVEKGLRE
jgi:hypothetical protein